jgi:hypothetical protein
MATIRPFATPIVGGYLVSWSGIASNDTCIPFPNQDYTDCDVDASALSDRSIQVFVGGGAVHFQGSNAKTVALATLTGFHTLNDAGSNALTLTTSAIKQVLEHTFYVRPAATTAASGGLVILKATANIQRH